jgi:hypothetical protein
VTGETIVVDGERRLRFAVVVVIAEHFQRRAKTRERTSQKIDIARVISIFEIACVISIFEM